MMREPRCSRLLVAALVVAIAASLLMGCGAGGGEGSDPNPSPGGAEDGASRQEDEGRGGGASGPEGRPATAGSEAAAGAARCYVGAVNDEDLDALVGCFAPEGVVVDVSRRIEGRDAIREWAENEVIGGTLRVIRSQPRPDGVRLLVHWAPAGSDGWRAYYTFEAREGRILVADLQYA